MAPRRISRELTPQVQKGSRKEAQKAQEAFVHFVLFYGSKTFPHASIEVAYVVHKFFLHTHVDDF
jgi:hypothetical protein